MGEIVFLLGVFWMLEEDLSSNGDGLPAVT
jgi:hypothetical protein